MNLTEQVKSRARELGADLVGVAPVGRFAGAPLRMSPEGLLPGATCVVVCGIHHLDAAVELGGDPTPHECGPYHSQTDAQNPMLDDISFRLGRFLEAQGFRTVPISASNIWRYNPYKDLAVDFAPDLAHRYAATAAGLAEIGWSGLALTPQFGPRCRFVSVVTDAPLEPSPMYSGDALCDKCMQCVETCPTDAFRREVRRINEIEIGGRRFKFPEINKWRCAWAENFTLNLALPIPDTVDESVILRALERYGKHTGELGCCLQFCMNPQNRTWDRDYCRPPRRRKTPATTDAKRLLRDVETILENSVADAWAVADVSAFDDEELVNPTLHLPDAATVVSLGFRVPPGCDGSDDVLRVLGRQVFYTAFNVAHHLDLAGYSAISETKIFDERVAKVLDVYDTEMRFTTVLTSARIASTKRARKKPPALTDAEALRAFCRDAGADLVGFFSVERFDALRDAITRTDLKLRETESVEDGGIFYGPWVPRIRKLAGTMKGLEDHLAGAQGVIVLGLHFPDGPLDFAKTTPAETVGPFTFVRYEAQRLLADAALCIVRRLNDSGHRATFTHDLTGTTPRIRSSRGDIPGFRSNRFAAVLAGLGRIGLNGCVITPAFGVRQQFIAVVTDMELPDDPMCADALACDACDKPCVGACPTQALGRKTVTVTVDGSVVAVPEIDAFACDWATRYNLAGEEGPRYCGLDVDAPLPAERSAKSVAEAVSAVNWGVQKRHLNIVEECVRACPERGRGVCPAKGSSRR